MKYINKVNCVTTTYFHIVYMKTGNMSTELSLSGEENDDSMSTDSSSNKLTNI